MIIFALWIFVLFLTLLLLLLLLLINNLGVVALICFLFFFVSSKGDFDGAVAQYIKTISKLEPSYVIRKVNFVACDVNHNS